MDPTLPPHLTHTFFPNHDATGSTPNPVGKFGPHLAIKFRDPETLEVIDCTIQDYGTSQLKGDWYEVVYGETHEMQITAKEMKEIVYEGLPQNIKLRMNSVAVAPLRCITTCTVMEVVNGRRCGMSPIR